jgi:hypothetical protein
MLIHLSQALPQSYFFRFKFAENNVANVVKYSIEYAAVVEIYNEI